MADVAPASLVDALSRFLTKHGIGITISVVMSVFFVLEGRSWSRHLMERQSKIADHEIAARELQMKSQNQHRETMEKFFGEFVQAHKRQSQSVRNIEKSISNSN